MALSEHLYLKDPVCIYNHHTEKKHHSAYLTLVFYLFSYFTKMQHLTHSDIQQHTNRKQQQFVSLHF